MAKSTSKKKPAAKPVVPTAENVTEQPAAAAGAGEGQTPEASANAAEGASSAPGPDQAAATPPAQDAAQGDGEQGGSPGAATDVEASGPLDATVDDAPAVTVEPSVDSVLLGLRDVGDEGAVLTRPDVHLAGDEAMLLLKLYKVLAKQGFTFRTQGDVVGWLLRQILDAMPK